MSDDQMSKIRKKLKITSQSNKTTLAYIYYYVKNYEEKLKLTMT